MFDRRQRKDIRSSNGSGFEIAGGRAADRDAEGCDGPRRARDHQ